MILQHYLAAMEDYANARIIYDSLVRVGNRIAEDMAVLEPNSPERADLMARYETCQTSAASAQVALDRAHFALVSQLLTHMTGPQTREYEIADMMNRLRIAGADQMAVDVTDELEDYYHDLSRIPEEAR
jgi:hypothetical protein